MYFDSTLSSWFDFVIKPHSMKKIPPWVSITCEFIRQLTYPQSLVSFVSLLRICLVFFRHWNNCENDRNWLNGKNEVKKKFTHPLSSLIKSKSQQVINIMTILFLFLVHKLFRFFVSSHYDFFAFYSTSITIIKHFNVCVWIIVFMFCLPCIDFRGKMLLCPWKSWLK